MIQLCWTFQSMPELAHLDPDQRRQLLRRCVGRHAWPMLLFRSLIVGVFAVPLLMAPVSCLLHPGSSRAWMWALLIGAALAWTAGTLAFLQFSLLRIRAALRYHLMRTLRGQRLPFCLKCGYNLSGTESDRCSECGAPVRIPDGASTPAQPPPAV